MKHENIKDAYQRIFGDSVEKYNESQQREDRQINDYYEKIRDSKQSHIAYELIVQVGSKEQSIDKEIGKDILKEYANNWADRNPNLEMVGCYYHADERGEPHLHIDFIPKAEYEKGMPLRNSLSRAIEQQDHFKSKSVHDSQQIQWERKENNYLERICRSRDIEVEHPQRDSKEKQIHRSQREFKSFKEEQRQDKREKELKEREIHQDSKEKDLQSRQEGFRAYDKYFKEVDRYCENHGLTESQYQREIYMNRFNQESIPPEPERLNPDRQESERELLNYIYRQEQTEQDRELQHSRDYDIER